VDAQTLARQLAADPDVAYAVPNGRKRIATAPNDPLYAEAAAGVRARGPDSGQWYLRAPTNSVVSAINIEAAWARTRGSASVVVAVLDTGVRFEHPDLGRVVNGGVLLPGYDFVSNAAVANDGGGRDGDPSDPGDWVTASETRTSTFSECDAASSSWHGTSTASLVAATTNNGLGMASAAPGVRVLPVRVLGKCFGSDADIQAGMLWAAGIAVAGVPDNPNPAKVINMSLGGAGVCDAAYQDAVNRIVARGVVIVAAAGNSAGGAVSVPANCSGVIGVAALRHAGTKVGFSDLGPQVSIAAPGGNCINITSGSPCLYPILAATDVGSQGPLASDWTDSFNITVGTSFSSPLVAAVAGLMVSQRPALLPAEVRTAMQATARPFPQTGGDNGPDDPRPVAQCQPPVANVDQLQCYCTTALCGAGMLDAGAAVAAVSGPLARLEVSTSSPTAGQPVALSGAGSLGAAGVALTRYEWVLVNGGGIVTAFNGATNAATATLTPNAAGSFTVRLTVTDTNGATDTASTTVTVAAVPVVPPVTTPPAAGGGGGGGATSLLWVLGVLLAVALLHRCHPAAAGTRPTPPQ
jgi:serine protease